MREILTTTSSDVRTTGVQSSTQVAKDKQVSSQDHDAQASVGDFAATSDELQDIFGQVDESITSLNEAAILIRQPGAKRKSQRAAQHVPVDEHNMSLLPDFESYARHAIERHVSRPLPESLLELILATVVRRWRWTDHRRNHNRKLAEDALIEDSAASDTKPKAQKREDAANEAQDVDRGQDTKRPAHGAFSRTSISASVPNVPVGNMFKRPVQSIDARSSLRARPLDLPPPPPKADSFDMVVCPYCCVPALAKDMIGRKWRYSTLLEHPE